MPTLYALLITAVLSAMGGFYIEHWRWEAADGERIQAEAAAEKTRQQQRDAMREADDHNAEARTAFLESERQRIEARYVTETANLRKQLRQPAACPAGGALGDVVISAGVVDSLRAAADQDRVLPPGTAASGTGQ